MSSKTQDRRQGSLETSASAGKVQRALDHFTSCSWDAKRRILDRGSSKGAPRDSPGTSSRQDHLILSMTRNVPSSRGVSPNALRVIQDPRAPLHSSSPSPLQHHGILQRGPSKRAPLESPGTSLRQEHLILSKSRKATSLRGVAPQRQCREEAAVVSIDGLTSCFLV